MPPSLFPAILKPAVVGFAIGFLLVGIARIADAHEAGLEMPVPVSRTAAIPVRSHWVIWPV